MLYSVLLRTITFHHNIEAQEYKKFSNKQTNRKHHKIYARVKLALAWRTVKTVTTKPRNNHRKAFEISGKEELFYERQIDIISEVATALKNKFMLRNKTPPDPLHKHRISKLLQLVPPDSTSKLTLGKAADCKERQGWSWTGSLQRGTTLDHSLDHQRIVQVGRYFQRLTVQPPPQSTNNQSRSQLYTYNEQSSVESQD